MDRKVVGAPGYLSVFVFIYLPVFLSIYVSTYLSTYLPIHLSTYVPIYLSAYLPLYLSTYLPIYLSSYRPIDLSMYYLHVYMILRGCKLNVASCNKHRAPVRSGPIRKLLALLSTRTGAKE